ncbi:MAG: DUF1501 domain-containing protein, partial [Planctomycetaceae bacterium]
MPRPTAVPRSAPVSRRDWLATSALGFGQLALHALLSDEARAESPGPSSANLPPAGNVAGGDPAAGPAVATGFRDPLAPRAPHFPATARQVIFLFMHGGVSHVDTFDPKPALA